MYPLKQSTALTVPFFAHDVNGDGVTGMLDGGFTKRISKNGAAFVAMTVAVTEMENGWYSIPVSALHSDTLGVLAISLSNASCKRVNLVFRVHARIEDDLAYPAVSGRSLGVDASGRVDLGGWVGVTPNALVSGRMDSSVGAMAANVLTATAINADAITAAKVADGTIDAATFAAGAINAAAIAADAIQAAKIQTGAITAAKFAAGAIDAAAIAADAITSDKMAVDCIDAKQLTSEAVNEIVTGVWDADATAHQTLGTFGQAIGDPVADTNTIYKAVVTDATGATVGVDVAAILVDTGTTLDAAIAAVQADTDDIQTRLPAALVSGRMDSSVGAMAADTLTASALAADAVTEIQVGLATSAALATAQGDVTAILADTADMQPKLGTPAADISADIAAVKVDTAAILVDTGTTLDAAIAAVPTATENADALLARDMGAVTGEAARSPLNALRLSRNKWGIVAGVLTVTKEDDSTPAWTSALTTDAAADPIVSSDPV